ncbi:Nucleosome assembly protein (NAP) protein [Raphanus sativus]|nr:Nucleosome assembly protein (NAP) protein [Raphanus sativus]KAJ4869578.1 Nucleosome assembly protein (NAP) protein [Raphanus sativus]KAJ4885843.1 Nucleosome assembly protein (NAP) protein [Raphanus sativus]
MAGQRSDVLESLTPQVRNRVEALRDIQGKHDELDAEFREERAVLETKYDKLYQPLYTKKKQVKDPELGEEELKKFQERFVQLYMGEDPNYDPSGDVQTDGADD